MKFLKQAQETWRGLKEQQKALVFQSIWFGKILPEVPLRERGRIQVLMNKIKARVGKFPGLMYKQINEDITEYKQGKKSKEELIEKLFVFYPIKSSFHLKVSREDLEFNKQMRFKIVNLGPEVILEIEEDLKKSEERDKQKILASI